MPRYCQWKQDTEGAWLTDCENTFCPNGGSPIYKGMKFCCYCGRQLEEVILDTDEESLMERLIEEDRAEFAPLIMGWMKRRQKKPERVH